MGLKSGQQWSGLIVTKAVDGSLSAATSGPAGTLYVNGVANGASVTVTGSNPYRWTVTLPALAAGDLVSLYMTATIDGVDTAEVVAEDVVDTQRSSDNYALLTHATYGLDQLARTGEGGDTLETLSDQIDALPAGVWAYPTRTLTQGAASVIAAVTGDEIVVYRGTTWRITFTGLPSVAGYETLWFAVKRDPNDPDSRSVLLIRKNASGADDGLLVADGSEVEGDARALGSITVDDATTLTIAVDETVTATLEARAMSSYGIKMLKAGAVSYIADGAARFTIAAEVPRAIA